MACARCDFHTPKASTKAQLVESKAGLQRMFVRIPLTGEERAAVDDGQSALDRPLELLTEVTTPLGPTLSDLRAEPGRPLPLAVRPLSDSTDRKCC